MLKQAKAGGQLIVSRKWRRRKLEAVVAGRIWWDEMLGVIVVVVVVVAVELPMVGWLVVVGWVKSYRMGMGVQHRLGVGVAGVAAALLLLVVVR